MANKFIINPHTGKFDATKVLKETIPINDLSDTNITSVADNDILSYDAASGKWINADASSVDAAGSDTWVQFNDGGLMGADAGLTFNKTTNVLTAGGLTDTSIADTQVVYSNSNRLTGDAGLTFASGTGTLSATEFVGGGAGLTGLASYWDRVGTVLSPLTAGDDITTTGTGSSFGGLTDSSIADTQVVYSDSGRLVGDSEFVWKGQKVGINIATPTAKFHVVGKNDDEKLFRFESKDVQTPDAYFEINEYAQPLIVGQAATNAAWRAEIFGDAEHRFVIRPNGKLEWGSGSAAVDIFQYRYNSQNLFVDFDTSAYSKFYLRNTNEGDGADIAIGFGVDGVAWTMGIDKSANKFTVSGDHQLQTPLMTWDYTTGDVEIPVDDNKLGFGAAGITDSYIQFGGTNLEYYSSGIHDFLAGDITTTGTIKGANYQSGDGSAGITQSETGVNNFDIVIKDGLITSFTKNS